MRSNLVSAEIAEPYARALMSVAQSNDLLDRFGEDVAGLLNLLANSEEMQRLLESPLVKADTKKTVLQQVLGEQVHLLMMNFLMVLVDRGRILFLTSICKQFQTLLRQLNQTVLAEVTAAIELNDEQREAVRQKVLGLTQARQVELETSIDPDLIGGVIIRVGSQVVDASLRGQLRRIGMRLTSLS
jgi:F-type H+-transporting ATPase subunit delta